ncbi:MAG: exosortase C-terminal domain/associated protein EpsI, partial [Sedimenticolaceae bacterium]
AWDLLADHRLFGWIVFLLFVVAQMVIGARFKDPHPRARPAPSAPRIGASYGPQRAYIYLVALALIASMVMPPTLLSARSEATRGALEAPAWLQPAARTQDAWHPVFVCAQAEFLASHPVDDRIVDLYLAYYWHQDADAELVGWPNAVYDGELWHPLEQQSRAVMLEGRALGVTETRLRGPQRARRLTWHWYWVDGTFAASPLVAKLLQAKATLLGGDTRSAVVVVSTPEQSDPEAARQAMQHFVEQASFLSALLTSGGKAPRESAGVAAAR